MPGIIALFLDPKRTEIVVWVYRAFVLMRWATLYMLASQVIRLRFGGFIIFQTLICLSGWAVVDKWRKQIELAAAPAG